MVRKLKVDELIEELESVREEHGGDLKVASKMCRGEEALTDARISLEETRAGDRIETDEKVLVI